MTIRFWEKSVYSPRSLVHCPQLSGETLHFCPHVGEQIINMREGTVCTCMCSRPANTEVCVSSQCMCVRECVHACLMVCVLQAIGPESPYVLVAVSVPCALRSYGRVCVITAKRVPAQDSVLISERSLSMLAECTGKTAFASMPASELGPGPGSGVSGGAAQKREESRDAYRYLAGEGEGAGRALLLAVAVVGVATPRTHGAAP